MEFDLQMKYELQHLRRQRKEPEKIVEIAEEIEEATGLARIVPKFGDGKNQASYLIIIPTQSHLAYNHETAWSNYEAMQKGIVESGIRSHVEPYFVCAWDKALGIKNHDGTMESVEWLSEEKVPDRFTEIWDTAEVRRLREVTVEKGGKQARIENRDTAFFKKWNKQLDPDKLETKIIFWTVDMALANKWLIEELSPKSSLSRTAYIDEGVAGHVNDQEIEKMDELLSGFTIKEIDSDNQIIGYKPKDIGGETRDISEQDVRDLIKSVLWIKQQVGNEKGTEMKVESFGKFFQIGYFQSEDSSGVDISAWEWVETLKWHEELVENEENREKLLAIEKAVKWVRKFKKHGAAYMTKDNSLVKMGLMEHQLERLNSVFDNLYILRATWSPSWDETMGINPELVGEKRSIRNLDTSKYDSRLVHVKYQDSKASMEKEALHYKKNQFLWKLLDETDILKIGPKEQRHYFSSDFDHYKSVAGKDLRGYEEQLSTLLPRLPPNQIVYEAVKEFKELPADPNNEDVRNTEKGSLQGYHKNKAPLLQAIWEDRVEAPVVDSLFRIARNPDDNKWVYFLGNITTGIRRKWFDNLEIHNTITRDQFVEQIIHKNRMYQKAIEISQEVDGFNLQDRAWTTNRGEDMKVDLDWAKNYFSFMQGLDAKKLSSLTGRSYSTCRNYF